MRRSRTRLLPMLPFLILLSAGLPPANAQQPPDEALGMNPEATYHGDDFDVVDMSTGRVHIHIPLVADHSQRGKLNFTYSLTYTSTGVVTVSPCPRGGNFCTYAPSHWGTPQLIADGNLLGTFVAQKLDPTGSKWWYAHYVEEADGTQHPLGGLGTRPLGGMESIDGSAIYDYNSNLTNKEGILFNGSFEDQNGNKMTQASTTVTGYGGAPWPRTTITDTLGRTWTRTDGVTDLTGCPTGGPVAPSYATTWVIPAPANVPNGIRSFKLCYSTYTLNAVDSGSYLYLSGTRDLVTGVVLPDNTTWRFDYTNSGWGDLVAVYPPTGGSIKYTWTTYKYNGGQSFLRVVASRQFYDGTNTYTWNYSGWGTGNSIATDPVGNDTVYTPGSGSCVGQPVTQIRSYSGSSATGTLLKAVIKSYLFPPDPYLGEVYVSSCVGPYLLQNTTTQWPNGQQSQVSLKYDSGFSFTDQNTGTTYTSTYGLVTSESHYDYGSGAPGPLLSTTNTIYQALSSAPNASSYLTANILDLPSSVTVTDGAPTPNKCAETDYGYDEYTLDSSGVTEQHVAAPNSVQGNLTSITRQVFSNPCTSPNPSMTPLKTIYHVYDTGMRHTATDPATDPNGNTTTYAYSPTFYGAFVTQTTMPSTSSPNPANHIISGNYDFNTGLLTSFTDQNNNTTSYTYDVMLRATNATYPSPDGGQTNFYYPNTTTVEMKKQIDASRWTDSFVYYDGLGRESRRMSINDESIPYDQVDTCYDAVGRVQFKTYPYQGQGTSTAKACSNSAEPGDTFAYDPLNRTTSVTHSDGSSVLTSYTGRATSVQDEGNGTQRVQRISQVDGLGRLTSVCEVTSTSALGTGGTPAACNLDIGGTGFPTTYTYDALSDLTAVSQGGYLPRSFTYDSLSRLVSSSNPEAGTITYSYLNSSGLLCSGDLSLPCQRTSPKPTQTSPSVTVTASMTYDQLNRPRTKSYANSDNSTTYLAPSATFNYDETSALGVSGLLNTDGRPSSSVVTGSQAGEVFSYDKLGRAKINSQCTPQNCAANAVFPVAYTYDLLGNTLTATNGMGVTFTYPPYNRALRIMGMTSSLSDANHPGTLYSGPHYNAAGSVASASFGNSGSGVNETRTYDSRLRLAGITEGTVYNVSIPSTGGYAPDGDILQAVDSANGTWSYGYDPLNRLCGANQSTTQPVCGQSALYTYAYDRFGNRWQQNGPHSSILSFSGNNNRMDGYSYDAAGNLLNDGTSTYAYDSESRIISASNSISGASSYLYDANGRRIRKTTPSGGTVDFLYDLAGHEIIQVSSTGSWTRGEVYAGGRHVATYSGGAGGTTYFNFSDWLATERARSLAGATTACETVTSLPFGDGQTTAGSCGDPSPMHFTGKERDSETGLDNFGARYDSSQYGRFMSPDWSGKPQGVPYARFGDPQSLNLYAYVENNPIGKADPDGHNGLTAFYNFFFSTANDPPPSPPPPPPPGEMEEFPATVQNRNQQASKPVPVVVVTSDTTHPAPFTPGVVERDRVYAPGTMDANGNVIIDRSGNSQVTLTEKKTAGNDNPTNCASGCTEKGALEDQIHVSGKGKYSTFRQDFRVNSQPALIVSGRPDDLTVSPAQIVHASAERIEIDPSQ